MEFQPSFPAVNDGENKTACYVSAKHGYRLGHSLHIAGPKHSTVPVIMCRLEVEPATPTLFLLVVKEVGEDNDVEVQQVQDVEVRLGILGGVQVVPDRVTNKQLEEIKKNIELPEDKEGWRKLAFLLDKGLVVEKIGLYLGSNCEMYLGHFSIHCLGTQENEFV